MLRYGLRGKVLLCQSISSLRRTVESGPSSGVNSVCCFCGRRDRNRRPFPINSFKRERSAISSREPGIGEGFVQQAIRAWLGNHPCFHMHFAPRTHPGSTRRSGSSASSSRTCSAVMTTAPFRHLSRHPRTPTRHPSPWTKTAELKPNRSAPSNFGA